MEENHLATNKDSFVQKMCKMISMATRYFRIHASGDFFSKNYFNKWVEIAKKRPLTIFLAFTRNHTLDLENVPDNLIIYYSIDHTTEHIGNAKYHSIVESIDKTKFQHLDKYKDGHVCLSTSCSDCLKCWIDPGTIYFPQKYKKYQIE